MKKTLLFFAFFLFVLSTKAQLLDQKPPSQFTESSEYLETVQKATFRYFWDFAHPVSGMIPERTATPNIVTSGGTGMGISCIVVGVHRNWISRKEAVVRLLKIVNYLEKAERFHGVWSHWLDGKTGRVIPFGSNDNGGDLVETAYLINGLLVAKAFFDEKNSQETDLRNRIKKLYETVEWDWYASRGDSKLYWHWSADKGWIMNMPISGYNECLITYALALGSPTHPIKAEVYENTWKKSNHFLNGKDYLGYKATLGFDFVGPLFFAHYSYLTNDPRLMQDEVVNYWQLNLAQTMMNYKYCIEKAPKDYGYAPDNWGLTASDDYNFYDAHNPANDNGTISPTAALSSFAYSPIQAWQALRGFYLRKGNRLFGEYGFYDAFNEKKGWYSNQYLAIDQAPIVIIMENYRSGLIWKLGRKIPEIWEGFEKMKIQTPVYESGFPFYLPDPDSKKVFLLKHPDFSQFHIEFTVQNGQEPISILLKNDKKEIKLLENKSISDGIHQLFFDAEGGEYNLILKQKDLIKTIKVVL